MGKDFLKEIRTNAFSSKEKPLVSVCTTAYNIECFLPKAIESVLMQKTNFKVEMIIGEDCSLDNTQKIALEYRNKYPEIIRVLIPEKNQGITPNFVKTHNTCKGKYIALLDGDDYWTDPLKLQKQVDFLKHNKDYSAAAHQSTIIYEDDSPSHNFGEQNETTYEIKDTISDRKFHTSSLVYYKEIWDKVGGIPKNILVSNDRALYPLVAIFGKIKYFKEPMCIYRKTKNGISSCATFNQLKTELLMIPWLKKIDKKFPYLKFKSFIHLSIFSNPIEITFLPLIKHYFNFVLLSFSYFPKNLGDIKYGTIEMFRIFKRNILKIKVDNRKL